MDISNGKPAHGPGSIIPINTEDLSRLEIEDAVLQVLAQGRRAAVDEVNVGHALWQEGEGIETATVTYWANAFAAQFGFTWERRRLFGDLLFSLAEADTVEGPVDPATLPPWP